MHVAEGTPAVPAVLLRVLAVHFAAFVDLDLMLKQLGIVMQLLQLDVPEELLEAAYGGLLVRRCRHRGELCALGVQSIEQVVQIFHADLLDEKCLLLDLASTRVPRFAHAPHNYRRRLCRNSRELSRPVTFTATRMLITTQKTSLYPDKPGREIFRLDLNVHRPYSVVI